MQERNKLFSAYGFSFCSYLRPEFESLEGLLFGFADVLNGESSGTRCLLAVTQFKKSCSEKVTYLQCLIQRGMEYPSNGDPA